MEPAGVKRKLAVILAADAEGFTRLMREAEEPTLQTLTEYRTIIDGLIGRHDGRVFGTAGDSVVAEFGSAVEAVRCALSIQEELAVRNAELSDDRKLRFRVGINVGDVMAKDDDLFGDAVNVAARLEGLAEPGGICVSASVFEQVKHKLSLSFEDIGPQTVKNVAEPVPAFRIVPGSVSVTEAAKPTPKPGVAARWRIAALAAVGVVVVAVGGVALWQTVFRPALPPPVTAAEKTPAPALPDRPSIAVLPFDNMSDDAKQGYFSDGITEDLITDLSKISGLFVVSRKAAFTYKGKDVKPQQVSQDLGVRYVLEGSVRKSDGRVRINAQLIDATTGGHLWAERYDRDLKDIFALQDEITQKIVAALEVKLTETEQERIARRYTDNLEAYDYFLRGREFHGGNSKEDNVVARQLLERAIELDPKFAAAYAELSWIRFRGYHNQWSEDPRSLDRALELARKALALDDSLPDAHARLGWMLVWKKQYQQGIAKGRRAIELDPNYADGYLLLGHTLIYGGGSPEEAIRVSTEGMRHDPYSVYHFLLHIADGYWTMGKYEEALANLKRSLTLKPEFMPTHLWLAVVYASSGRIEKARTEVAEVLRLAPRTSVEGQRKMIPYKDQAVRDRFIEALREAGLPEKPGSAAP